MKVRDILEIMDGGILLFVKNVDKNHNVVLSKFMMTYCSNFLLNLHVGKLNAGDYTMKGEAIDWRSNGYRGKVIVCEVDEGGEE